MNTTPSSTRNALDFFQLGGIIRNHNSEANSHIENAEHFFIGNVSCALKKLENRRQFGQAFNSITHRRFGSNEIEKAISCNVKQSFDLHFFHHLQNFFHVDSRGDQKFFAKSMSEFFDVLIYSKLICIKANFSSQCKAVAMQPAAIETNQEVSFLQILTNDDVIGIDSTNCGPNNIEADSAGFTRQQFGNLRE